MTKFIDEEQEEIMYEKWLLDDGPKKAYELHLELATSSRERLQEEGWKFLSSDMVRESFTDFAIMECIARKGERVVLLRWKPFNKDWMMKGDYGWVIFHG